MRVLIDAEFKGAGFAGSQSQPGLRTVQGELIRAASDIAGEDVVLRPCSRLDVGVSAQHFPCDFAMQRTLPMRGLVHAFNKLLPDDLCVRRASVVADDFNAIHQARSKTYRYRCVVRGAPPARDSACMWVCKPIHAEILHACAALLPGTRDLGAFSCLRHDGRDEDDAVRTIHAAQWVEVGDDGDPEWRFTISGNGFLYKQVRALVGAMVWAAGEHGDRAVFAAAVAGGRGHPRPGDIAPAQGLCLAAVRFDPEPSWVWA